MAKPSSNEPTRCPKGWDRAESCTDDLTKLALKFFGKQNVTDWMGQLKKHIAADRNFTGFEAYLSDTFANASIDERARMFFEEVVARCLYSVADVYDDGDTDEEGRKAPPPWGEKNLKGYTFRKAILEVRPNGYAKVRYMGKTSEPEVPGMIGINCTVYLDGEPYRKPTVLFVSKPFHQYRAVAIRR